MNIRDLYKDFCYIVTDAPTDPIINGFLSVAATGFTIIESSFSHEGSNALPAAVGGSAAVGFGLASLYFCIKDTATPHKPPPCLPSNKKNISELDM